MKFYIASKWGNKQDVRDLAAVLKKAGHKQSHDWTRREMYDGWERDTVKEDAFGVVDADMLILMLPGGRGAHAELGIAIGTGRKIVICMENESDMIQDGYGCPFYWCDGTTRIVGSFHDWVREILRIAHEMDIVAEIVS